MSNYNLDIILERATAVQSTRMIGLNIHVFPGDEKLTCYFDENKSFADLKNELIERQIIKKGKYYIEMNDSIMNDHIILRNKGVVNNSNINVVRNDYVKIKLEVIDESGIANIKQCYMPISDFEVIKADENNEVKVCYNANFLSFS